jgi:MSHA biogenesis protein MshM
MRRMYLDHFGLNEPPFRITPATDFFFDGANRGQMLDALLYAVTQDEGIVKVVGEVGTGKTMLCRVLAERLPRHVDTVYIANPSLAPDDIPAAIAHDLRVNLAGYGSPGAALRGLQTALLARYAQGKRVVVLIDEAHAMPPESLEAVRLLSNLESSRHKLLQLVLFGQPELDETLAMPNMRQLRERIVHSFSVAPMVAQDIGVYVTHRLKKAGLRGASPFTPPALKLISQYSVGLTRRVNILADKALMAAFAGGEDTISAAHVKAAFADAEFRKGAAPSGKVWGLPAWAVWSAGTLLLMAVLVGLVLAVSGKRIWIG